MQVVKTFKTNYQDYFTFLNVSQAILPQYTGSKLAYAIERVIKLNANLQKNYQDTLEDIRIDNANTDEKGSLLTTTDKNGKNEYQFTKEGAKNMKKQIKELLESEVEVSVYHATELPESYEPVYNSYLLGFVLDPNVHTAEYEPETIPPVEAD